MDGSADVYFNPILASGYVPKLVCIGNIYHGLVFEQNLCGELNTIDD